MHDKNTSDLSLVWNRGPEKDTAPLLHDRQAEFYPKIGNCNQTVIGKGVKMWYDKTNRLKRPLNLAGRAWLRLLLQAEKGDLQEKESAR